MAVRAAAPGSDRAARRRWLADRRLAFRGLLLVLPFALLAALGSLAWVDRPFPGFFVMSNGIVPTVGLSGWSGISAGVPFHARLVAIDGRPIRDPAEAYGHAAEVPVGTPVDYTFQKHGADFVRRVATMRFAVADYALTVGLFVAFGVLATFLSTAVGIVQPHSPAARAFVVQGVVTALFGLTGTMLYHPRLWWTSPFHLLTQAMVPAALINLGFVFPAESPLVREWRGSRVVPWVLSALLVPWMLVEFRSEPPRTTALYLAYYYTIASILILVGFAVHAWVRNVAPRVRPQLRIVLPGLVFGLSASLYGFINIAQDGGNFPLQFIAPFPAIFYVSVAWAIARYDLFDIDRHLKGVIVYGLLTIAVAAAYACITTLASWLGAGPATGNGAVTVAFFVLVATLFEPMRRRVQRVVERAFFRSRPDYRRTVRSVSNSLTALLDRGDILQSVGRTIADAFRPESLHELLWLEHPPAGWTYRDGTMVDRIAGESWPSLRAVLDGAPDQTLDATVPQEPALQTILDRFRAALVVPLSLGGRSIGAFVLGPRRSRQRFTTADRHLLSTLAAQTAIALANAQSYRALQRMNADLEAKVRARTGELERSLAEREALQVQMVHQEKMASLGVLVAGVAHEINNPVTFIVGTVPPLRAAIADAAAQATDAAQRGVLERAGEMVDVVADGAARTASIVQDLRSFSRLGEAEPRPMDVHEALDVVLRLIRPRWADRITMVRDYGAIPLVEAAPEQLSQVFMNLLVNACDAISARGSIQVATRQEGATLVVAVRDDGNGIAVDAQSRVFDPFFSTKPTGQGTGLGLAISHGIVARHGGRIELSSTPGIGSEFRVILPLRQSGRDLPDLAPPQ